MHAQTSVATCVDEQTCVVLKQVRNPEVTQCGILAFKKCLSFELYTFYSFFVKLNIGGPKLINIIFTRCIPAVDHNPDDEAQTRQVERLLMPASPVQIGDSTIPPWLEQVCVYVYG